MITQSDTVKLGYIVAQQQCTKTCPMHHQLKKDKLETLVKYLVPLKGSEVKQNK